MKTDDLLMFTVVIGFILTCAYIAAEVLSWQSLKAAEVRDLLNLREVYRRVHLATKPLMRAIRRK